jgi:phosphoribosylpyrophosphate synthetase
LEQAAGRFCPKITVVSVAELFAKAIKIIHDKESLSILFE